MVDINYSGKEGCKGKDGIVTSGINKEGQGENGQHAQNIDLFLQTDGLSRIQIYEKNQNNNYFLRLGYSENKINLFSIGGKGGDGGRGGDGKNGSIGIRGQNATRFSCGTDGGPGEDGQDGGNGGN
ncbi:hypothetical protein ABPG74_022440 [Tetrahymena malaccensis]